MGYVVPQPPRVLTEGIFYRGEYVTIDDVGLERFAEMLKDVHTITAPVGAPSVTVKAYQRCAYCGTRANHDATTCPQCGGGL